MTRKTDVRITIIVGVKSNIFYAKIYTALNKKERFLSFEVVNCQKQDRRQFTAENPVFSRF